VAEDREAFRALHRDELQPARLVNGRVKVDQPTVQLRHDTETERLLILLMEERPSVVPGSA